MIKKSIYILFLLLALRPTLEAGVKIHKAQKNSSRSSFSSSINLPHLKKKGPPKRRIIVAVVDTGVDFKHPFLESVLLRGNLKKNATRLNYGKDFTKKKRASNQPKDLNGHGTHIAGIIKSVNPYIKIVSLKYYKRSATAEENIDSTIRALKYAIDKNVDIINYSSGGEGASLKELRVLKEAQKKGILVITAAGNYGKNIDLKNNNYYPASYNLDNIISEINHKKDRSISSLSNFGKEVADISAPGTRIRSSLPGNRMGILSGTSQSTAFVTGVASLIMQRYQSLSMKVVKMILIQSAKKVSSLEDKCRAGGILDAKNALDMAGRYVRKLRVRSLAAMRRN